MAHERPRLTVLGQSVNRDDVITAPLSTAIAPDAFTPRLIALLDGSLGSAQAQGFRDEAGRSINDWRVLAAVAITPGQSASEIADSLSINKSMLSPTVNRLAEEGLIVLVDGPRGSRPMYLTADGARVHDDLAPIARRGQDLVDAALSADEVQTLNALLRRLLTAAPA